MSRSLLQHGPGPGRYRLDAHVRLPDGERLAWTFWVELPDESNRWRKAAIDRALNQFCALYPDRLDDECEVKLAREPHP